MPSTPIGGAPRRRSHDATSCRIRVTAARRLHLQPAAGPHAGEADRVPVLTRYLLGLVQEILCSLVVVLAVLGLVATGRMRLGVADLALLRDYLGPRLRLRRMILGARLRCLPVKLRRRLYGRAW